MPCCRNHCLVAKGIWGTSSPKNITRASRVRMKRTILKIFMVAAVAATSAASARAQTDALDRTKVLRAAADALGMVRWADIGNGATRLPGIDVVNTMEFWAAGAGPTPEQAFKTEYHVALGYNPAAMR